jgi:hypothetical protein
LAKILPKRSSTGGSAPGTDDLAEFEIAINYSDRKIYGRSGSNIVVLSEPSGAGEDSYTENTFTNGVLTGQSKYTTPLIPEHYYGDISYNGTSARVKLGTTFSGYADVSNVTSAMCGGYQSNNGGTTVNEWKILGTILYFHTPGGSLNFADVITAAESQQGVTVEMLSGATSSVFPTGGGLNLSGSSLTKVDESGGPLLGTKAFTYTSGNLTSVVEKDGSDVTTLTKTLTYDSDGNLESITKDYA